VKSVYALSELSIKATPLILIGARSAPVLPQGNVWNIGRPRAIHRRRAGRAAGGDAGRPARGLGWGRGIVVVILLAGRARAAWAWAAIVA